jgi:hypothetical protein
LIRTAEASNRRDFRVAYDAFIFVLTAVGIVTVIVYSYKINHSRVSPIGMVRSLSDPLESVQPLATEQQIVEIDSALLKATAWKESWRCESCGLIQPRGKDSQCRRCKKHAVFQMTMSLERIPEDSSIDESGQLALEGEIAEHGETLKEHDKIFRNFEKRIRQLELESLQKSQEYAEERPGISQPRTVH